MQSLANASLVERDEAKGRFRLHDLVRQFCEGKLGETEITTARFCHAAHFSRISGELNQLHIQGGKKVVEALELFDRERPHLEAAFDWLEFTNR